MHYDNINGEAAHLRDVFLKAEKEYVKYLLQFDDVKEMIIGLNLSYDPSYLFQIAQNLIDRVEAGEFSDEEMESVERKLTVLLAAIHDKVLIKELVRLPDYEEELGHGCSR